MEGAISTVWMAREPEEDWRARYAPPEVDLPPCPPREIFEAIRSGDVAADECERILSTAARVRGAIDVGLAEGLHALGRGDRLESLACHRDDYAREVLDLEREATRLLVRLGGALATRPLLREGLRSGRVKLRAAQLVQDVAVGEAEALWVERAARLTVRALAAEVRRARAPAEEDEPWLRLRIPMPDDDRAVVDAALELAGEIAPGAKLPDRWEAIAQEYLGEFPDEMGEDEPVDGAFRPVDPRAQARKAALEEETDRWCQLPEVEDVPAPDVRFEDTDSADEVDAKLRELARLRAGWNDIIGWSGGIIQAAGLHLMFGFADFGHFIEERYGLPSRPVEQRLKLEKQVRASPALAEARRQKLAYEKLRLLATLPEKDIGAWTPRAHALTVTELRFRLEANRERQMRGKRKFSVALPPRVALLLSAAIETVRRRTGERLPHARCLAILAVHFIRTWDGPMKRKSRAQRVRERDEDRCQVPGCSHLGSHAHHLELRSHGGSHDPKNQIAACPFHHLRCIHGGYLRVVGEAPHKLRWFLRGRPWNGPLPVDGAE